MCKIIGYLWSKACGRKQGISSVNARLLIELSCVDLELIKIQAKNQPHSYWTSLSNFLLYLMKKYVLLETNWSYS